MAKKANEAFELPTDQPTDGHGQLSRCVGALKKQKIHFKRRKLFLIFLDSRLSKIDFTPFFCEKELEWISFFFYTTQLLVNHSYYEHFKELRKLQIQTKQKYVAQAV